VLTAALITIIALALVFDYTNGFHDAANAIASAVSTRALTPRIALIIAAGANLGGALLSTGVAVTIAKSIIDPLLALRVWRSCWLLWSARSRGISLRGTSGCPPRLRRH
jgi:phosphate/sulfate permease